jgi:hypothetical protein
MKRRTFLLSALLFLMSCNDKDNDMKKVSKPAVKKAVTKTGYGRSVPKAPAPKKNTSGR